MKEESSLSHKLTAPKRFIENSVLNLLKLADGAEGKFERPQFSAKKESNIKGLYVIGDLAGAPVIKLAMADGFNVIEEIAKKPESKMNRLETDGIHDVVVIGAGAAGLNAALAAQEKGFSVVTLEKSKIANTIENFPEGKWVYAEPDTTPAKGKLWLDGSQKEDLVDRWNNIVEDNKLDVRTEEELLELKKRDDGIFVLKSSKQEYLAGHVVLATGQRGNPRKLNVAGEEQEIVYHRLYSPKKYKDESIIVVGGGNSAIEAAIALSEQNKVYLSYRKPEFGRVFKDNLRKLKEAEAAGSVEVLFSSNVKEFGSDGTTSIDVSGDIREIPYHHAFVLIGADLPIRFLKKLGFTLSVTFSQ